MTFVQRAASPLMNADSASPVCTLSWNDSGLKRARNSGSFTARAMRVGELGDDLGRRAGRRHEAVPQHGSMAGMPSSRIVGTSGRLAARCGEATASTRSLSSPRSAATSDAEAIIICVWPPISACRPSGLLR